MQIFSLSSEGRYIFILAANQENQNFEKEIIEQVRKTAPKKKIVRILVVDDEETFRETFAQILREESYEVETATDGYEAIEKVKTKAPDIIFLDIKLPGMNGVETLKMIREINPGTTTLMMTAYSVSGLVREGLKEGAYTCLYKPFEIGEMLNLIKKVYTERDTQK